MKTRIHSVIVVLTFALAGLAFVPKASAQDESLNAARSAFDAGQDLFAAKKFVEAAEQFKIAYKARPFAQFLFNTGACYEKAADYTQAIEFYEKYLGTGPSEGDVKKTKKRIEALKKAIKDQEAGAADPNKSVDELEKIEIRGLVVIESEPQGANIYLDSKDTKPLSKSPWNGTLTGEHTVYIEKKGYKVVEKTIRPDPNKLLVLYFALAEEDYLGYIDVTSNIAGADIYIDDKGVGVKAKTPWSGEIEPGKHKIWVTKEGYDEYEIEVEVIAGETHKVAAELSGEEVGYINVRGKGVENNSIYVDGDLLCKRGPCLEPLKPGKHKVSIRRSGYKPYNQTIDVQSKTEVTMRAQLAEEPSRMDAVVTYLFAAAFAGGGYYLGGKAKDIEDDLRADIEAGAPPPDNRDPRLGFGLKSGKTYATLSTVSYAASAGTLLLAIYYTFREKGKNSTGSSDIRAISLDTQVSPTFTGVGVAGSF